MTDEGLSVDGAIDAWKETRDKSDESVLRTAMRRAAERVSEEGQADATELYRGWVRLVDDSCRVQRGTALSLWDEVDKELAERECEEAEAARTVIYQTLISMWSSLADKVRGWEARQGTGPDDRVWIEAVAGELLRSGRGEEEDEAAFASLCALLDLAMEVHRGNNGQESTIAEWARAACRQAEAVKLRAMNLKATPCAFPDSPQASTQGAADAARVALALRVAAARCKDDLKRYPTVEEVGEEILWIASQKGTAVSDDVARMLRYHGFESSVVKRLLKKYAAKDEIPPMRPLARITSVGQLEQSILMLGPHGVGKTSFLFASEALCGSADQPNAHDEPYPPLAIERLSSPKREENRKHSIELQREDWMRGNKSKDAFIRTAARAGPKGLCSYWILDTMGELVLREDDGEIVALIERLRHPGIVALMVEAEGHNDEHVKQRITETAERVINQKRQSESSGVPVVYLIVNKLDDRLKAKKGAQASLDTGAIAKLVEETNKNVFNLTPYLDTRDTKENRIPLQEWATRILGWVRADARLTRNVGTRELILENIERWAELLKAVVDAGVTEVYLTFVSSLPDQTGSEGQATPSVEAFWKHIWESRQRRLEEPLASCARSIFCEQARANAMAALEIATQGTGLQIPVRMNVDTIKGPDQDRQNPDGGEMRRRIRHGTAHQGKGLDSVLASLSSEQRCISNWRDRIIAEIGRMREDCEALLPRAVMELNLDPAWDCTKLQPNKLDEHGDKNEKKRNWLEQQRRPDIDAMATGKSIYHAVAEALEGLVGAKRDNEFDEKAVGIVRDLQARLKIEGENADDKNWSERHRLKHSDVDGYFGSLRAGSLLADAADAAWKSSELHSWLTEDGGLTIGKKIEGEIRKAGTRGLSPEMRAFLWQLADHGPCRDTSKETIPDYGLFAPKRWSETERLLLHTLIEEKDVTGSRIGRAIGIMNLLVQIVALGLDERGALETRVRKAIRRILIERTFHAMGLKRSAWEDDRNDFKGVVESIRADIKPKRWNVKELITLKGWSTLALAEGEEELKRFWEGESAANLAESRLWGHTRADRQLAFVEDCLNELDAMGPMPVSEKSKDVTEVVKNIWRPVEKLCNEYNSTIALHAAETAIGFLVIYARWLDMSLSLTVEERKNLERTVFRKRKVSFDPNVDSRSREADSRFDADDVNEAIRVFEQIIAARAEAPNEV